MKVYDAHNGSRIDLDPTDIEDLEDFKKLIANKTNTSPDSLILLTLHGLQLRQDMFRDALINTGQNEYTIFAYDRSFFDYDSEVSRSLIEHPELQQEVQVSKRSGISSLSTSPTITNEIINHIITTFQERHNYSTQFFSATTKHFSECNRLIREIEMQHNALQVALTNLDAHSRSVVEAFDHFHSYANKELSRQNILIDAYPMLLKVLERINVHPSFLNKRKVTVALVEYIAKDKMQAVVKQCTQLHNDLNAHIEALSSNIRDINDGTKILRSHAPSIDINDLDDSLSQTQACVDKTQDLHAKFERDLQRVSDKLDAIRPSGGGKLSGHAEKTIEAIEHLDTIHIKEYLPELIKLDAIIRDQVRTLADLKNRLSSDMTMCLREISRLQSSIAVIPSTITELDSRLNNKTSEFKHLIRLHQMPLAYIATVVEIVRRKEYAKLLGLKAMQLAEAMSRFRNHEQKRRDYYRTQVKKYVPIEFSGLDDSPAFVEVSTINISDVLPEIAKEDLDALISIMHALAEEIPNQLREQASLVSSASINIQVDVFTALQQSTSKLQSQLEMLPTEFERGIDKYVLGGRVVNSSMRPISSPTSSSLSRVGFSLDRRRSADPTIIDLETALVQKMQQLERADETVKSLTIKVESLEQENRELHGKTEHLDDANELNEGRLEAFQRELADVRSRLAEATAEQRRLETRNSELEDNLLNSELLQDRVEGLEKELAAAKRMLEEKWAENSGLAARNEELEKALELAESLTVEKEAILAEQEHMKLIHKDAQEEWKEKEAKMMAQISELERLLQDSKRYAENELDDLRKKMQTQLDRLIDDHRAEKDNMKEVHEQELKRLWEETEAKTKAVDNIKLLLAEAKEATENVEKEWKFQRAGLEEARREALDNKEQVDVQIEHMLKLLKEESTGDTMSKLTLIDRRLSSIMNDIAKESSRQLIDSRSNKSIELSRRLYAFYDNNKSLLDELAKLSNKSSTFKSRTVSPSTSIHLQTPIGDSSLLNWQQKNNVVMSSEDEQFSRFIEMIDSFDLDAFAEAIKTRVKEGEILVKKWQRECKAYRDKANKSAHEASEKIAYRNFTKGDLALFLPTRNNVDERPWAAFNINFPHYFLRPTEAMAKQLKSREWIVARIVDIAERVADSKQANSNPYGLADGVKYYLLEVESLNQTSRKAKNKSSSASEVALRKDSSSSQLNLSKSINEDFRNGNGDVNPEQNSTSPSSEQIIGTEEMTRDEKRFSDSFGDKLTSSTVSHNTKGENFENSDKTEKTSELKTKSFENEMSSAMSASIIERRSRSMRNGRPLSAIYGLGRSRSSSVNSHTSAVTAFTSPLGRSPSKAAPTTAGNSIPVKLSPSTSTSVDGMNTAQSPSEMMLRRFEHKSLQPAQSNLSKALKDKGKGKTVNTSWFK